MYKPVKKPVTLRLVAPPGPLEPRQQVGIQPQRHRALRKVMMEERKKARE